MYSLGGILREEYEGWDLGRVWVGNVWCRLSGWVEAEDVEVGKGAGDADRKVGEGAVWGLAAKLLGLE